MNDFLKCCGSTRWAERMAAEAPFVSLAEAESAADRIWAECTPEDWLEAFRAHPKIGEQSSSKWSQQEQSGVNDAAQRTKAELADLNTRYERKFNFIFIICATGKSADEMLKSLKSRMQNEPNVELREAAEQQRQITRLRLRKLFES